MAILGNWSTTQEFFSIKIIFFGLSIVLYLVIMRIYTRVEVNDRRSAEIQNNQIKIFENLVISISSICTTNASDIRTCINKISATKKIDLNIWSFKKSSRTICEHIYNNISQLGNSKKYEVAYIRLIESGNEDHVEMVGFANQNKHQPTVFGIKRRFKNINLHQAYHDLCLFSKASADTDIAMGADEINKIFIQNKGTTGKRFLYIGIPVFCDNSKMVGLLEIVGLDDTMLGCVSKEEIEEVTNKCLVPYAGVFLLIHKMERALLAGTGGTTHQVSTMATRP